MNIIGDGQETSELLSADQTAPDDRNEVYFGDIPSAGAIGVTIVWGIFSGPASVRVLTEWDQVYDDVDFEWTDDGLSEPTRMDFRNIAAHELGHAVGLDHPSNLCTEETMYRYASYGETKKIDLHAGDILGVSTLY